MIRVRVEIVGALMRTRGRSELELELDEGASVAQLLSQLGYRSQHIPHIVAAVDGVVVHPETHLKAGAQVVLSTLVGGG